MVPDFKLVETDIAFFDATVRILYKINGFGTFEHSGNFEWRAGTLSHKIAEQVQDGTVKMVRMTAIKHSSVVTSEALAVLSKL